VTQQMITP